MRPTESVARTLPDVKMGSQRTETRLPGAAPMPLNSELQQSYADTLLAGDRTAARDRIAQAISDGLTPIELLNELIWPIMEQLQAGYRDDRIGISSLNLATRLNRMIADQLGAQLIRAESNGKRVLVFCGDDEPEEL